MSRHYSELRAITDGSECFVYVFTSAAHGAAVVASAGDDGEAAEPLAVAADALARDVDRAARHLGLARWESICVECSDGLVAVARGASDTVAGVASAPAGTALGLARRVAARAVRLFDGSS